ncbi:MAG: tetratricopeptide repeat protein [Planctomycetota bacterium]
MALPVRRPPKMPERGIQKDGLFAGTAQSGPARRQRAQVLAEELLDRGCLYIQKQVWEEAAAEFRKAIQMEPEYPEAFSNLGLCLIYLKKYNESIEALREAVRLFPGWYIAEANLGLACALSGRNEDAAKHYERSLTGKDQPAVWLALGDACAALGKLDRAVEAFNKALAGNPRYSLAYQHLGMLYARLGNLDGSATALTKAVEIDPNQTEALALLGAIAARNGQFAKARGFFEKAASSEKVPLAAQRGARRLAVFREGLEKAFGEWKAGMPEPPPLAMCYYNLGLAQLKAGDQAAAKESFRQASVLDPKWVEPLLWFGFFAALDGEAIDARRQWEAVRKLKPDNGLVRELLGYLAVAMNLQQEGEAHFAEAAKLGRTVPRAHIFPDQEK